MPDLMIIIMGELMIFMPIPSGTLSLASDLLSPRAASSRTLASSALRPTPTRHSFSSCLDLAASTNNRFQEFLSPLQNGRILSKPADLTG